VLVAGEAGIGKTALIEAFCAEQGARVQVLWGTCDAVVPPRPFAPLADIADRIGGSLSAALDAGDRDRVFDSFLALLRQSSPMQRMVVLDDLHWSDEGTLDLLRIVGRWLRHIPILLIGTYRDDEVGREHPLRLVLGDLPSGAVTEIRLPPLSVASVGILAAGTAIDPVALHGATAGNPFFVTEAVASGADEVPATVRDAVLARSARLSSAARDVLRAAAVLGQRFEPELLRRVARQDAAAVQESEAGGMLQVDGDTLQFRHELAQRTIREGMTSPERRELHGRALGALRREKVADPARLARHAIEAGDVKQVLKWAPVAARRAAGLGAHREAAAQHASALRFGASLDDRSRAELLEGEARECMVIDEVDRALESQGAALECWRRLQDVRREGDCLRALSLMMWFAGEAERATEVAVQAVELLSSVSPPGPELARAYAAVAQRYMTAGGADDARAYAWAQRALELAQRLDDEPVAVHALTTIGVTQIYTGNESGWATVEESLRRAKAAELDEDIVRALINLVEAARDMRRYELVDRYRDEAIAYLAGDLDLDLYRRRLVSDLAETALERGRWGEAGELAQTLIDSRTGSRIRVKALTVLGRLRARAGDSDPWPLLDEGLAIASPRDPELLGPLHAARIEAAWLEGDEIVAGDEAQIALTLVMDLATDPWWRGEIGFWALKARQLEQMPEGSAEPYALHAIGRFRDAAAVWEAVGCPYQQALALSDSGEEQDLRQALGIFHSLGARPMARKVIERLRAIGARGIPRGPRPPTRQNPARLTQRELEVLALLAQGLRNADVAKRLVVSAKTVDHHVSSILKKLGVPNRAAAVREASRLGLKGGEITSPR
jgi:ATP/maltotriose-dependent transcriptional regulator MalT